MVLFASIEYVGASGEAVFSLICGCLSVVLSSLLYYLVDRKTASPQMKKAFAATFVFMWFFCAAILTFDGPFNGTGNGYFGTWFATFCALSFAYQVRHRMHRTGPEPHCRAALT